MTALADASRDRRRSLARPGGSYDRLIRLLAATLPILIGLVAAVMFFAPLLHRKEVSLILDRSKVATTDQRIALSNAVYMGKDDRGRTFTITAGQAVQQSSREPVVKLVDLAATLQLSDGPAVITAPDGTYEFKNGNVSVPGPVEVKGPGGYRLVTSAVDVDLRARRLAAIGGARGALSTGTFSADTMTVDLDARTITLEGRVRLRMTPGRLQLPN